MIQHTTATVVNVYGSPGPASEIRWDIDVNMPEGYVRRLEGIGTVAALPPDDYDSIGQGVGTDCLVSLVAHRVRPLLFAFPDSTECT